ncbi:hypothetical protein KD940_05205, partial [Treponema pallidum]
CREARGIMGTAVAGEGGVAPPRVAARAFTSGSCREARGIMGTAVAGEGGVAPPRVAARAFTLR